MYFQSANTEKLNLAKLTYKHKKSRHIGSSRLFLILLCVVGVFPVVPDVLNVVVILEHLEHLAHVLDIVLVFESGVARIRNGPMSAMCSGLYSYGLRHQMAENMSRGLPYDAGNLLMISIRELYGLTCFIGIGVLIIFLLWDIQPIRSTLKKMPAWNFAGRKMKKNLA